MSIDALRERVAPPVTASPAPRAPPTAAARATQAPRAESSSFAAVLQGLGQQVQRGESLMRTALDAGRAGRELGTADLIVLQAGVYRYGEVVDLASRLVDRATSSVKTVLEGQ
jgi:hypothetical protein